MRQIAAKLNTYVRSIDIINNNIEKLIFNIILWSALALALFYILFLGNMVKNIIERRSLEANARTLASEVRDLELAYLNMSSEVDISLSHSMGFKETEATFATRKKAGKTLGLSGEKNFGSVKAVPNDL